MALVAVFAVSAVASASASAFTNFVSKPAPQSFAAEQVGKHKFTISGSAVECEIAKFKGKTEKEKQTTLKKVEAVYEKCTAFGFVSSTVNMNGCTYGFNIAGEVEVECPTGKEIEIAVSNGSGCAVKIGTQSKLKSVTYTNVKGKNGRNSVEINVGVKKVKYTSNEKGFGCPKNGGEAEYKGIAVAEGATGTLEVS